MYNYSKKTYALFAMLLSTVLLSNTAMAASSVGVIAPSKTIVVAPVKPANPRPTLMLGVNGHVMNEPYTELSATNQIQMLNNMHMNIYRIGAFTKPDGTVTLPWYFNPILKAAEAGKVTLLIMLQPRTMDFTKSEADSYEAGKTIGANFAKQYGASIKYYELGNELDNKLILPGQTGRSQVNYDADKFKVVAAYLKGMDEGIKSQDPDAQTMVDAGWLHYAYLRMLDWYGVKFNIVAYHWYSNMEDAVVNDPSLLGGMDISTKLSSFFPNKPIWYTEVNALPNDKLTAAQNEEKQSTFVKSFVEQVKKNPKVQAVVLYELLNEKQKTGREANFGITKWVTPTQLANKRVADDLINGVIQ
jgi:hypothetical protein